MKNARMVPHMEINLIHHINRTKHKNYTIISTDVEKAFDRIEHPFIIKILRKLRVERNYLNIIKAKYERSTATIILNGEKLEDFPLRSGIR